MTLLASDPDVDQPDGVDRIRVFEEMTQKLQALTPVGTAGGLNDEQALRFAGAVEKLGRLVDAHRVAVASDISHRSRPELLEKKLSTRKGCRNEVELLERVTLVSGATVRRRLRLGKNFRSGMTLTGEPIPAAFPVIGAAVAAGALGLDGADAIITVLTPALPRVHPDQLGLAEAALVAAATGTGEDSREDSREDSGEDSGVPVSADLSRAQAALWLAHLNPDGAEPREEQAMQNRGFRFGREQGGLIPVTGMLMPETAAAAKRVIDAYMSPRTAPVAFIDEELAARGETRDPGDTRTPDQKRHDIFAVIVATAAKATDTPTIAGDAPTVLVSVRQEDLAANRGVGHIDGVETPISMDAVRQMICAGGLQKVVLKKNGKIVELGTKERTFNRAQRRAIMLRVDRNPPRLARPGRRTHPHEQRRLFVLVPPPHHRNIRVGNPHDRRVTTNQSPTLDRQNRTMATRHQITHPAARPTRTDLRQLAESRCWQDSREASRRLGTQSGHSEWKLRVGLTAGSAEQDELQASGV